MQFLDSTIFLSFLTHDDPESARVADALFYALGQGTQQATTTEAVITVLVQLLSAEAPYHLSPADIRGRLTPLLTLRGLRMPQKRVYLRALDVYAAHQGLSFVDALVVAEMEQNGVTQILSCNTAFDQVPSIRRIPADLVREGVLEEI